MALVEEELPGVGKGKLSHPTNRITLSIPTCTRPHKWLFRLFCSESGVSSSRGLDPRPATPGKRMYVIRDSQNCVCHLVVFGHVGRGVAYSRFCMSCQQNDCSTSCGTQYDTCT